MQSNGYAQFLLTRMQAGERAAVGELYDLYGGMLYALAHRLTHSAAEAEEVMLDVFTQAWHLARSYDAARSNVMMWLVSLTGQRLRRQPAERRFAATSLR